MVAARARQPSTQAHRDSNGGLSKGRESSRHGAVGAEWAAQSLVLPGEPSVLRSWEGEPGVQAGARSWTVSLRPGSGLSFLP